MAFRSSKRRNNRLSQLPMNSVGPSLPVQAGGGGFAGLNTNAQQIIPSGGIQTGLTGGENAIRQGLTGQLTALGQGIGSAQGEIDAATGQAIGALNPFLQGGAEASQLQAAQSGALGPEAQAQAFQNFQNSPGQQFALEQVEQGRIRNAAATGGLGGGNIRRELDRVNLGNAQQNFQQQFQNLGQVAGAGRGIAGQQAGIFGQQGANLSNLALQGGILPAQAIGNAASNISNQRFTTGQQIAQAAGGTTSGLANLQNQLGQQASGVFGQGSTNLANLVSGTGQASSQLQQQLGTILANVELGLGSTLTDIAQTSSQFDAAGILGQNTAMQNALSQLIELFPRDTQQTTTG